MATRYRPYKNLKIEELGIVYSFYSYDSDVLRTLKHELIIRKKNKIKQGVQELINKIDEDEKKHATPSSPLSIIEITSKENFPKLLAHHIIALKIEAIENKDNPASSTKRLLDIYESLRRTNYPSFNANIFRQLHGNVSGDSTRTFLQPPKLCVAKDDLNDEQWEAIIKSSQEAVTLISGPPGTGKSKVLSKIILNDFVQNKKILLVSHANLAVDQLLKKLCDHLSQQSDLGLYEGQIRRIGKIQNEELKTQYSDSIVLDCVVKKLRIDLGIELANARRDCQRTQDKKDTINKKIQAYKSLQALEVKGLARNREYIEYKRQDDELREIIRRYKKQLEDVEWELKTHNKIGRIWCFFVKKRIDALYVRSIQISHKIMAPERKLDETIERQQQLINESKLDDSKFHEIVPHLDLEFSSNELCTKYEDIGAVLEQIQLKINELQQEYDSARASVKQNGRVFATTTAQACLSYDENVHYDTIIFDEVSMIPFSMVAFLAGMAQDHVVLAGDYHQLVSINQSNDRIVKIWLDSTVFDTMGVVDAIEEGHSTCNSFVGLKTQYRMVPEICNIVNTLFYSGMLRNAPFAGHIANKNYPRLIKENVIFIDTSSQLPVTGFDAIDKSSRGRCNVLHAALTKGIVDYLLAHDNITVTDIGVITPYKPQSALLKDLLITPELSVGTAHKFQGSEREIIIFDTTDSYGAKPSIFCKASNFYDAGARLLCVALSRAKSKLIILADRDYIIQAPELENSFIRRLIHIIEDKAIAIDKAFALIGRPLTEPENLDTSCTRPVTLFADQKDYTSLFNWDIENAKHSITLFSPDILEQDNEYWDKMFSQKVTTGVKIRLITTRNTKEGNHSHKIKTRLSLYKSLRINIEFLEYIPGLVCIFDENLLWHSPIEKNIPPIPDKRITTRIKSPMACRQLETHFRNFQVESVTNSYLEKIKAQALHGENSIERPSKKEKIRGISSGNDCNSTAEKRSKTGTDVTITKPAHPEKAKVCPECGKGLVVADSKKGKIYRCEGYPHCFYTTPLDNH